MNIRVAFSNKDLRRLRINMKQIRDTLRDLRPVWKEVRADLKAEMVRIFDAEGKPIDVSWPALRQASLRGGKKLRASGKLRRSMGTIVSRRKTEMTIGSKSPYAKVHNFGWGKKGILRRKFIGVTPTMEAIVKQAIFQQIEKDWGK